MYEKKCLFCGKSYESKTKRSRYCSDRCRNRARDCGFVRVEVPHVRITEESVSKAVAGLRSDAEFFDAASVRGPERCRDGCRIVSAGIASAIEKAGL